MPDTTAQQAGLEPSSGQLNQEPVFDENVVSLWAPVWGPGTDQGPTWGITTQRDRHIPSKSCVETTALVVAGVGITGGKGVVELALNDYYCLPDVEEGLYELNNQTPTILLATAAGSQPVYMTTETFWRDEPRTDLGLRFFSWGIGGRPVPDAVFQWHLTVATVFPFH